MTDDEAREYVARWKQAGPALEKIRREELRKLRDDDVRVQVQALFGLGGSDAAVRPTTGLVEQQRLLRRQLS